MTEFYVHLVQRDEDGEYHIVQQIKLIDGMTEAEVGHWVFKHVRRNKIKPAVQIPGQTTIDNMLS